MDGSAGKCTLPNMIRREDLRPFGPGEISLRSTPRRRRPSKKFFSLSLLLLIRRRTCLLLAGSRTRLASC